MSLARTALVPFALILMAGCTPFTVRYDYDSHASFAAFKTFDWYAASARAKGKAAGVDNPLMDRRVRNAVEHELTAKGLKQEKAGEPDLLVTYYPVYRNHAVVTTTGYGGWGYRPYGFGVGPGFTEVRHYQDGSIVIELVDNKANQLIWRAVAEGALSGLEDPHEADEQVGKAVKELMNHFPPAPGK